MKAPAGAPQSSLTSTEFKQLMKAANAGDAFELDLALLRTAPLVRLAENYFAKLPFRVAPLASVTASADGNQVTVAGTGTAGVLLNMVLEAQFTYSEGSVRLDLKATAPAKWRFVSAFPSLRGTAVQDLAFVKGELPRFRLSSADDQGLSFDFQMDLAGMSGGLSDLLGLPSQSFTGFIKLEKNGEAVQQLEFSSPPIKSVDLSLFTVRDTRFRIGSYSTRNFITGETQAVPYITFSTTIPFTAQGNEHVLPLSATLYNFNSSLKLSADLTGVASASLDEIEALAKDCAIDIKSALPPSFHLEDFIKLDDFFFVIDFQSPKKLAQIGFDIRSARPWPLFHLSASNKDFALTNVQFQFRLNEPFGAKVPFLTASGEISIGKAGILTASANYPSFVARGGLKDGTTLDFSEVLVDLLGPVSGLPELTVSSLGIDVAPESQAFQVEIMGYMPLGDSPLVIREAGFDFVRTPQQLTAALDGTLTVADIDIRLSAAYNGAGNGWLFSGATDAEQAIPIGDLLAELAVAFGIAAEYPKVLTGLTINGLSVSLDTSSNDVTYYCELKFPVSGGELDLTVDIAFKQVNGKYEKTFQGQLIIADVLFDLDFETGGDTTLFWGDYENTAGKELAVRDLLALLTTDADLLSATQGLQFNLKDAFAGYLKGADATAQAKWLLGLDMDFGADLTALPLVGKFIPKDESLRLAFQPRIATEEFTAADLTALKALISGSAIALPENFAKGLTLHIELSLGTTVIPLALPIGLSNGKLADQPKAAAPPAGSAPAPADKVTWLKLQKSFGPLQLERVGVKYESGELTFLLDGGFSVAGLTIALMGLSATTQLHPFDMSFGLDGLSLDYKGAGFEISGAFLREKVTDPDGKEYIAYDGAALIKAESFSLSAIGSYADYQGHPSMFIYAVLDSPLGGPAFFFVTGLAAGFGFNRALKVPGIDQIQNFPLVSRAVNGPTSEDGNILAQMHLLNQYIPPDVGEYFLAVGIRFTTFKIIDSFALLIVSLGTSVEIDLLGLSTLVLPAQTEGVVPPLAEVQMALKASYQPTVGFLSVEAKLTPASFLFSHDCHLTGGFAFYTWFLGEHKDDFAVTLGGYHPSYQRPAHYPVVDKLGFNWALSNRLTIKGDAYFALVPSMVMAGTHLSAVWEDGNLRAWFNAGADFLLAWQPYHYDARMYVDMGVSYTYHFFGTHHISVDVGADLHIWGPEFAGTAEVHLWIVSFTVNFGNGGPKQPAPISWTKFRQSFLPDPAVVCSLAVKHGLESKQEPDGTESQQKPTHPVLSPKGFVLSFDSVVPFKKASLKTGSESTPLSLGGGSTNWGVAPMGLSAAAVASEAVVTITSSNGRPLNASHLLVTPTTKGVPVALWGQSVSPSLNGPRLVNGAVCGFDIRSVEPTPGQTAFIDSKKLEFDLETASSPLWQWASVPTSEATAAEQQLNAPEKEAARREYLRTHLETVQAERSELLRQLGITAPVFPDQSLAQAFVFAPQLV